MINTCYGDKVTTSATEKTKLVVAALLRSRGVPLILDDVKKESGQRQREKSRISTDVVLRSVFQGEVIEEWDVDICSVDTCAIITGEYMDTMESQNARLLYMNVSGFLNIQENSQSLSYFQRSPEVLATFMGDVIRWMLNKCSSDGFMLEIKKYYMGLMERRRYSGSPDYNRLFEAECAMRTTAFIFEYYIHDSGLDDIAEECGVQKQLNASIDCIVEKTAF